eukprot:3689746-Pleurochrysis_carterae.AAC.1
MHRVSPYFAARMHAKNVARQRPQTSQHAEPFVPRRYRQRPMQPEAAPARVSRAPPPPFARAVAPRAQPAVRAAANL